MTKLCKGHPRTEQLVAAIACIVCGNELIDVTVAQQEFRYGRLHRVGSERHKRSADLYEPEPEV